MDFPSTSCLTSPDQDNCAAPPSNVGCPEGFVQMNSQNFTTPKCVPENVEDVKIAQRERST